VRSPQRRAWSLAAACVLAVGVLQGAEAKEAAETISLPLAHRTTSTKEKTVSRRRGHRIACRGGPGPHPLAESFSGITV
jgi:hypothetical protein